MKVECLELRIEGYGRAFALCADSHTQHSTLNTQPSRNAFTLVELLVVIMIIAILAALVLGVAAIAGETARESHSRHMVDRLHTLVMEHYETYKNRRAVPTFTADLPGQVKAAVRLSAIRQVMRMEMPDRWSDVVGDTVDRFPPGLSLSSYPKFKVPITIAGQDNTITMDRTDLASIYLRRYAALKTTDPAIIRQNQGAECLYMMVTLACGDGEARTLFAENTIGDTDGDGAPEFLDGWGHPITFIRWPFGFESSSDLMTGDPVNDHDPFDPFRVQPTGSSNPLPGARLVPLIVSPGRDEKLDLLTDAEAGYVYGFVSAPFTVSGKSYTVGILDPYANILTVGTTKYQMGDEIDTDDRGFGQGGDGDMNYADNVHNHLIGKR